MCENMDVTREDGKAMIHRMLRYPAKWDWHMLQLSKQPVKEQTIQDTAAGNPSLHAEPDMLEVKRMLPACSSWLEEAKERSSNHISVDSLSDEGAVISGTLMVQVSEEQADIQPFHFWLSATTLVTMHGDMRLPLRLQSPLHTQKYEQCGSAPEAFFIMIGVILESFHAGLDGFERRLGELEKAMRHRNRSGLIDTIFDRRYDLLHWSHLFIPVREVHGAAKEAFMEELTAKDAFQRITHKLDRIDTLLKHYSLEIDTLISMDDAMSSFKGNDIIRTLTIFTVLCLPGTVAGTLMGSNFHWLPLRDKPWGFVIMIAVIAIITGGLYMWLWKKGWTGDILRYRKRSHSTVATNVQVMEDGVSVSRSRRHAGRPGHPSAVERLKLNDAGNREHPLQPRSRRKKAFPKG